MSHWTKNDLTTAAWLSRLSTMEDEGAVRAELEGRGCKLLTVIHNSDTDIHGLLVGLREGVSALVFRCTSSWTNTKSDLRAAPEHGMGVTLHSGFWAAYQSVARQVHLALIQHPVYPPVKGSTGVSAIKDGDISLLVVGHSLGGALASLAALDMTFTQYPKSVGLITFGCPRVGFSDFVEMFEERMGRRYVRVMYQDDFVSQIPVSPYKNPGGILHIDAKGRELGKLSRGWVLVRNWFRALFRFGETLIKWESLSDHAFTFYNNGINMMSQSWKREI